jgi:CBS-domain-containing membrane protein
MHRHRAARLAWCLLGAGAGIALALFLVGTPHATFVLASLGGSSVFLFPGSSLLACALAVSLSLDFALATRTVHPPAGANPVIMVYAQAHWWALLNPVLLGVACLVHYPVSPLEPFPPSLNWGGWQ